MERVAHVTTFADSLGGMQAIVRRHRAQDAVARFDPTVVKIFEGVAVGTTHEVGLAARGHWTIAKLRRRFVAQAQPTLRGTVAVYHNGWALPLLAPGDGARRRLAYLHTDWPYFHEAVQAMRPWCDGLVVASREMSQEVLLAISDFPPERIHRLPYPVDPPPEFFRNKPPEVSTSDTFRAGIVGRLETTQKRLDRLPALVRAVAQRAPHIHWSVLGSGPELPRLQRELAAEPVTFHGRLAGEVYWRQLAQLDAIVFLSDYEGCPIALLEAMTCGAIPLYPSIGGPSVRYAREVDPRCVYPAGDLVKAAENLVALSIDGVGERRRRARATLKDHRADDYDRRWIEVIHSVAAAPRISSKAGERAWRASDLLPLAVVARGHESAIWR
jgi:glycosyltransferase involved in cell wall biosynthesis